MFKQQSLKSRAFKLLTWLGLKDKALEYPSSFSA